MNDSTNPETAIRPAPEQFTRDGYVFSRIWRRGMVAIYEQRRPGAPHPAAWEVVMLRVSFAHPDDADQSLKERYPGNEDWGKRGFTLLDRASAEAKALWLAERESENPADEGGATCQ